jgi:riboflavin kinase/FMN adenylyltransferase
MNIFRGLSALPEFKHAVITIGSFDGVHVGHQKILKRIQQLAEDIEGTDVVITFHPHPREIVYPKDKELQIITTLDEKLEYFRRWGVSNVVIVPFTIEFSHLTAQEYIERFLVERFHPKYIVIGYDHKFGANRQGDVHLLKLFGRDLDFEVIEIPEEEVKDLTVSSTRIRNALAENNIDLTNSLLGHPYMIKGKVVTGNRLGHHIGFPTANVKLPDPKKILPQDGIFAATAMIRGIEYKGMLYIGLRPSIESQAEHRVEINLFNFDKQIYDEEITVEVYKFIRSDKKFASMEDLKVAMQADERSVREYFNSTVSPDANVATVILNYNGKKYLEEFLPYFRSSRFPKEKIFVIDNASTDGSVKWLRTNYPSVTCLTLTENKGYAGGYNEGLTMVNAKYFALVNSDVEITPNWLIPIINMMEQDETIAAAQPKILAQGRKAYFEYAGASGGFMDSLGYPFCRGRILQQVERDTGQYDTTVPIFWASGAALVIRSQLFREVGGFDPDYFAHQEEIDLGWRLLLKKYKIVCCPDSVVYHVGGGTLSYNTPNKVYYNFRNNIVTLFKYLPEGDLIPIVSLRWLLDGLAGLRFLSKGQFGNMFAIIRAHFYIYRNLRAILAKRKEIAVAYQRLPLVKLEGVYQGSIIMEYYLRWKRKFSQLFASS